MAVPDGPLLTLLLIALAINTAACSVFQRTESVLQQHFDEKTGANVTSVTQPMVFYRERPWLASNTRDYVYLGPIEVSRSGKRSYLLWLGIWSTIDRLGLPTEPVRDTFQTVYLVADGEPMEIAIETWSGRELGMANPVYSTPVESASNAYYDITKDQMRRLTRASNILLYTNADELSGTEYMLRKEKNPSIAQFASYLSDG